MSTRAQILAEIAAQFPDNTTGLITPAKLRQVVEDVTNSCLVSETDAGTAGIAVLQAETTAQGRTALGVDAIEAIATNSSSAPWYSSYATGLAAVADGAYFAVTSVDGFQIFTYKRSGTTAILVGISPADKGAYQAALLCNSGTLGTLPTGCLFDFSAPRSLSRLADLGTGGTLNPLSNVLGASRPSSSLIRNRATNSGLTLTWDVADSASGTEALRIAYDGAGTDTLTLSATIPAGQWTLAMDVLSNTGGSCTFKIGVGSTPSAALTATTTWSTVTTTLVRTAGADYVTLFTPDSGAADITIDNVRLVPGAAAGSVTIKAASLSRVSTPLHDGYVIKNTRTPAVQGATHRLTFNGEKALTEYTVSMLVRRTEAALTPETNAMFTANGNTSFSISNPHGTSFFPKFFDAPMISLPAQQWVALTYVYRASGEGSLWVNGCKLAVSSAAAATITARYFDFCIYSSTADMLLGEIAASQFWDRALSDSEVLALFALNKARAGVAGGGFTDFGSAYIAEGDSITYGYGINPASAGYAFTIGREFSPFLQGLNFGVTGSMLSTLEANPRYAAALAAIARIVAAGKRPIMSVVIGTNDASGLTSNALADAWAARLFAYFDAMRAAGAKVIATTTLDRQSGWNQSVRSYLNDLIRAGSSHYDALADLAADASVGAWGATYYVDATHPSIAGHAVIKGLIKTAIQTVWVP